LSVGMSFRIRTSATGRSRVSIATRQEHARLHQRRQTYWGTHIIGENEERRAVGYDAPVHRQSIKNGAHPMVANAKVQVAVR
jgi:hypothetical protein